MIPSAKTYLLFDMDGVLLQADGYYRSLQETVSVIARSLGFPEVALDQGLIHFIESVGVTSEWDSSAICIALLLHAAWQADPTRSLPENPYRQIHLPLTAPPPDLLAFFTELGKVYHPSQSPLVIAEGLLLNGHSPEQAHALRSVLRNARRMEGSLTFRLLQELILGSQVFAETYALPPFTEVEGYLAQYDQPLLTPPERAALGAWLEQPDHHAAIFTNRPSRAPGGAFNLPEAEFGARVAGVEGVPIMGFGPLAWFAERQGLDAQAYLKPSPVHVLAALWLASHPQDSPDGGLESRFAPALTAAAQASAGLGSAQDWQAMQGAQVFVFEDAVRGLLGAAAAQQALLGMEIRICLHQNGISGNPAKQQALARAGASVYPTLSLALAASAVIPFLQNQA